VGKRSRREKLRAPTSAYDAGGALELRGSMTPATRREYAELPARTREDAWQRAVEFLFERLAVSWSVAGAKPLTNQKELLARFRFAATDERRWIRDALREHLSEHFPELPTP
jgi:hypothetical protein